MAYRSVKIIKSDGRRKSKTKYSWKTSLPAYLENKPGKDMQEKLVLFVMRKLRGKKATLKEVQDYLRTHFSIRLPQSTISGRMNDLKDKNKVGFFGETKVYRDRLRKVFEIITSKNKARQRKGKKIRFEKVVPVLLSALGRLVPGRKTNKYILTLSDGAKWISKDNGSTWSAQVSSLGRPKAPSIKKVKQKHKSR